MRAVALVVFAFLLSGCGGTPGCNGSKVKDEVVNIIVSNVENSVWGKEMMPGVSGTKIEDIKTLSHDEQADSYSCAASIRFSYKGSDYDNEVDYQIVRLEDKGEPEISVTNFNSVAGKFAAAAIAGH